MNLLPIYEEVMKHDVMFLMEVMTADISTCERKRNDLFF